MTLMLLMITQGGPLDVKESRESDESDESSCPGPSYHAPRLNNRSVQAMHYMPSRVGGDWSVVHI